MTISRWSVVLAGLAMACGPRAGIESVYGPVTPEIGERRIAGDDTTYVVRGRGYTLVAPTQLHLADLKPDADLASFTWRLYLVQEPPRVTVTVGAGAADSADGAPDADEPPRRRRMRGDDTLRLASMEGGPRRRGAAVAPIGQMLARAWVERLADSTGAPLPPWFRAGLEELIAPSPVAMFLLGDIGRSPAERTLPLDSLFAWEPAAAGTAPEARPRRRGEPDEARLAVRAQAFGFLQFVAEREGHEIVAELVRELRAGRDTRQALRVLRRLPPDLPSLTAQWHAWLGEHRRPYGPVRRPG